MRRDTCPDLSVDEKLIITDAPSASSFSRLQGERVEQTDLVSELGELRRRLYVAGVGQNISSHSDLSVKTGDDSWQINNQNLNFMVNEIVRQEQFVSG